MYDPLGFVAPVILSAKQILQDLCRNKLGWDEEIPQDVAQRWQKWLDEFMLLKTFSICSCFAPKDFGEVAAAQLHHFCKASEAGYGWVSYLRLLNTNQEVSVAFIMGKARVSSLKQTTILSLELAAAVLAIRMDKMLNTQLDMKLEKSVF